MFSWHAIPFARAIIPFIIGIAVCCYQPSGVFIQVVSLSILLPLLAFFRHAFGARLHFRLRLVQGICLSICLFILGYLCCYWHHEMRQKNHFSAIRSARFYYVSIEDAVLEKAKHYKCYASVRQVCDSSGVHYRSQGSLLLYLRKGNSIRKPEIGQCYLVHARAHQLNEPANPGEFNYKQYLSHRNIHYQLFADSANAFKSRSIHSSIYRHAVQFRDRCLEVMRQHIKPHRELGVAEALLLGYKDDLDTDITSAFSRTGTLHVLAVSGLHAGIIFLLISLLTRKLEKNKAGKWTQLVLLLSGIWFYAFMTGLSSSVLRASVMFTIISLGRILHYRPNIYNTLFTSAFLLLVYNPLYIFDVGFQLSYLAVLGIVWLQPLIGKWYRPRNRIDTYIWDLLSVSLAAQVLTFPISVFYFHQFPNYFLLSNLFMIPLTTFILAGLILLLAIHWIPFLALLSGKILSWLIWFCNWLITAIDQLPYSFLSGLQLDLFQLILVYSCLILFIAYSIIRLKWVLFGFLTCCCAYAATHAYHSYTHERQRIFICHVIKGHDVFTCIEGRHAYIVSDSSFFKDSARGVKFFIESFLLERGVDKIKTLDANQNFVSTNIRICKDVGLQFFDNIMTIQNYEHKSIQNKHFLLLKKFDKNVFNSKKLKYKYLIISNKTSHYDFLKLKKYYFKHFGKKIKLPKKALIIFN